ncbi:hypothetical protein, partial [Falsiroseomonas sp. E2-1-a20]|uniref:hypothetical protein n=1 Tax=Falsiroseomonas sp. E2-1-a20 TaxID=3239300 RepID=UPI003F2DBBF7
GRDVEGGCLLVATIPVDDLPIGGFRSPLSMCCGFQVLFMRRQVHEQDLDLAVRIEMYPRGCAVASRRPSRAGLGMGAMTHVLLYSNLNWLCCVSESVSATGAHPSFRQALRLWRGLVLRVGSGGGI